MVKELKEFLEKSKIDYIENNDGVFTLKNDKTAQQVYQEWQANKIDNCSGPTPEERIIELEKEKKMLKAQVEALTTQTTFLEDCLIEVGQIVYA